MRASSLSGAPLVALLVLATASAAPAAEPPSSIVVGGTVRDFRGHDLPAADGLPRGHADFEDAVGAEAGIVGPLGATLGGDGRPVYAKDGSSSATTHGRAAFDQWFRDAPGVNLAQPLRLTLDRDGASGQYAYDSQAFFPVDDAGFVRAGQEPTRRDANGDPHNFSFTTEVHADLTYRRGDRLAFRGDDDVWIYVDGRLALDLGGVHGPQGGTVDLDARAASLGLVPGHVYALDVFQAERHTSGSSYRLEVPRLGIDPGTPTIPGSGAVGDVVTCDPGAWPAGVALGYAWTRDGDVVDGATAPTYAIADADAGRALACRVTGEGPRTSASADSGALHVASSGGGSAPDPDLQSRVGPGPVPAPPAGPPAALPPASRPAPSSKPPRACRSRRQVVLHLGGARRRAPRAATVQVGRRYVKVHRMPDGRLTAIVDLRGRRAGTYVVRTRLVTRGGRLQRQTRRFRTCAR